MLQAVSVKTKEDGGAVGWTNAAFHEIEDAPCLQVNQFGLPKALQQFIIRGDEGCRVVAALKLCN